MLMVRNIGQACRAVQARGVKDADTDGRVRDNAHTVLGGESSDRHELRQARVRDFWLNDADTAAGEPRPQLVDRAPLLAAGDGHYDPAGDFGLAVDILRSARRLREVRVPGFQRLDQRDRFGGGVAPVQIDHDIHVGTERFAQRAHFIDDAFAGDCGRELDPAKSLRAELARQRHALIQCRARQPRCVRRYAVAPLAAEKLVDGSPRELPLEIPERDVDAGQCIGEEPAPVPAHAHERVQLLP